MCLVLGVLGCCLRISDPFQFLGGRWDTIYSKVHHQVEEFQRGDQERGSALAKSNRWLLQKGSLIRCQKWGKSKNTPKLWRYHSKMCFLELKQVPVVWFPRSFLKTVQKLVVSIMCGAPQELNPESRVRPAGHSKWDPDKSGQLSPA